MHILSSKTYTNLAFHSSILYVADKDKLWFYLLRSDFFYSVANELDQ